MNRRNFFRSAVGVAASTAVFGPALAAETADPTFAAFASRRASQPWQMGYAGLTEDMAPMPMRLRGRLPAALRGALYRNGPARHQLGGLRYRHPFDGDGMVQKYEIGEHGIVHRGRFVRTDKFLADTQAGRPVRAAFGTHPPGMQPISGPDAINVANTSVLHHGGELLALWEGGSAIDIDPENLDTREVKVWAPEYAGMPFSAHPKVEPDGTLWNFGVSSHSGLLSIYRVAASGKLLNAATLNIKDIAMVHDFAVTERHLVFLLPPLVFDIDRARAGQTFLDSHVWRPELGMRVLLLHKDRLDQPMWLDLPAGFVFHIGNAWEDPRSGVIRLDCMRSPDAWRATRGLLSLMAGRHEERSPAKTTLVELDLRRGRARQQMLDHVAEFPKVDPRVVGRRYTRLFSALRVDPGDTRPGYDAVMRLNVTTGDVDRYVYGPDVMVEEHVFVPEPQGRGHEGDGWLVGTALDLKRKAMLFSVFDARRLADGPIAQGEMDRVMPLGLHGVFVPA